MQNLSIRDDNICLAIRGAAHDELTFEEAQAIYFRWKDRDPTAAEAAAYDWSDVARAIGAFLPIAARPYGESGVAALPNLRDYLRERTVRRRFPG